jgi:hypothetical protein
VENRDKIGGMATAQAKKRNEIRPTTCQAPGTAKMKPRHRPKEVQAIKGEHNIRAIKTPKKQ